MSSVLKAHTSGGKARTSARRRSCVRPLARRGGVPMRIVIAVVIALIGLISYFAKTETNPVTGEKQRVAMGSNQEMALGLRAAPEMIDQMGGEVPLSDPAAARVAEVGKQLAYGTEANKSDYARQQNFNFHLLRDDKTVNAFALPGGQIFITRALYNQLQNEAQLAGVLGHEVGHVIHRHGAEHMATGQLGQMMAAAVGVGASDGSNRGAMAHAAAQMANQMVQLKYGRDDERESDRAGIQYMTQLGYDPAEMIGVMEILKKAGGGGGQPAIFASHPNPDQRIADIRAYLNEKKDELAKLRLTKGPALP